MWGTTGCDIVLFEQIIVGEFAGKTGRVGDGNGVDGDDGSDGNVVILEVACMGIGVACGSHVVSVVLYKRDGNGSDMPDPSEIERVDWIPSVRSQSRLEC